MPQNQQLAEELHKPIILKKSNRQPNKIWVDKGSEFYNNSFKKWLQDSGIQHKTKENLKDLLKP